MRVTVADHCRPLDDEVDDLFSRSVYDMLRNANRISQDLVRYQKILGYNYDVLQPAEGGSWKAPQMADRAAFVRSFYDYARAVSAAGRTRQKNRFSVT
jgi:hypothetical protein